MSENKELLEATVKGLEEKIGQLNMDLKTITSNTLIL